MFRPNQLKQQLANHTRVYGMLCSIPTPASIELIGEAGYDFVIIDTEHVLINPETIEHMIRTAESYGLTALVRVADFNPKTMLRLLDGGAQGIVLPMVEQVDDLKAAIRACKYGPQGTRSLNAGRPGAFGKFPLRDYVTAVNDEIMVVAMIESQQGVDNIDDLLAVDGLDMILEGAADLSQSIGMPWQITDDQVQQALDRCRAAAQAAGIPCCTIPREPADHDAFIAQGIHAFVLGDERGTAFRALHHKLSTVKYQGNGNDL